MHDHVRLIFQVVGDPVRVAERRANWLVDCITELTKCAALFH
jgi:hypothetical protein